MRESTAALSPAGRFVESRALVSFYAASSGICSSDTALRGRPARCRLKASTSRRLTNTCPPMRMAVSRLRRINFAIAWRETPRRRAASACEIQSSKNSDGKLVDNVVLLECCCHRQRVCLNACRTDEFTTAHSVTRAATLSYAATMCYRHPRRAQYHLARADPW